MKLERVERQRQLPDVRVNDAVEVVTTNGDVQRGVVVNTHLAGQGGGMVTIVTGPQGYTRQVRLNTVARMTVLRDALAVNVDLTSEPRWNVQAGDNVIAYDSANNVYLISVSRLVSDGVAGPYVANGGAFDDGGTVFPFSVNEMYKVVKD